MHHGYLQISQQHGSILMSALKEADVSLSF